VGGEQGMGSPRFRECLREEGEARRCARVWRLGASARVLRGEGVELGGAGPCAVRVQSVCGPCAVRVWWAKRGAI
jgi:hypothetical protein